MTTKLKKAQIRALPGEVGAEVLALQQRYRTRSCDYEQESPGWQMYLAEGVKYTAFDSDGKKMSTVRMQHSDSLHAGGGWQSHQVGQRLPVPQGAWVVEFELFCGRPFIKVHHVGPHMLEA